MQIKKAVRNALLYLGQVIAAVAAISLLVAVTFLFSRNFSFVSLSERLFYVGLFITVIGGVVGMAAGFAGRGFGIPSIIRRPAEAKRLLDNFMEYREEVEKRYDTAILLFAVGVGCVAVSALIEMWFA